MEEEEEEEMKENAFSFLSSPSPLVAPDKKFKDGCAEKEEEGAFLRRMGDDDGTESPPSLPSPNLVPLVGVVVAALPSPAIVVVVVAAHSRSRSPSFGSAIAFFLFNSPPPPPPPARSLT